MNDTEKSVSAPEILALPILGAPVRVVLPIPSARGIDSFFRKTGRFSVPYIMVAPAILLLSALVLYPIAYMIWLSLFEWNMMGPKIFVGIQNFLELFTDPYFFDVMGNTFRFMSYYVTLALVIALALAAYLKSATKRNALLQNIIFIPYVVSMISIAFIWLWMMDSDYGLLNFLLSGVGLRSIRWLDDPKVALYSLILVCVWKGAGYNTIVLVSAMQAIPDHLYEAALLDRAGPLKTFFRVTLPMISPTLFFLALMDIIAAFKVFETVNVMTAGGPMNSTNTIVFDIYQQGFRFYKMGYASAQGVVLMAIIGVCTLVYFGILAKRVHYGNEEK